MKLGMKEFQMPGADMFWRHLSDECGFMSAFENLNIWKLQYWIWHKNVSLLYKYCIRTKDEIILNKKSPEWMRVSWRFLIHLFIIILS